MDVREPLEGSTVGAAPDYYSNCRWDVLELLGTNVGRVLDVGCGQGATGAELLRSGRASELDGIELIAAEAELATGRYQRVVVGDLETVDRSALDADYDTMLCNDVLEHVRDPWALLRELTADHVRPGGTVVVSIPNVQCVEVVGPLLAGRFDYADDGVLDRTHLRFFTRSTGRQLLLGAGLDSVREADGRIGASRGVLHRALGRALGPYGVRQLLFAGKRPMDRP